MIRETRYAVNRPDVIDEAFDGEFVVVNLRSGAYYALKQTAGVIWQEIKQGASGQEIVSRLCQDYVINGTDAERAVETLLDELEQETLIVPQANGGITDSPPNASGAHDEPKAFVTPVLEKFTDMREVLQLDPIHEVDDSGWPARKE